MSNYILETLSFTKTFQRQILLDLEVARMTMLVCTRAASWFAKHA